MACLPFHPSLLVPTMSDLTSLWTKKNPFLSLWLSGANAALGATRGLAMAESQRIAQTMMTKSMEQMTDFWAAAMTGGFASWPTPSSRPRKRAGSSGRRR